MIKIITLALLLIVNTVVIAATPHRVAVLPFYIEQGNKISDSLSELDYRRVGRFINNHLVKNGFDVVNISAADLNQKDYDTLAQRFKSDSQSVIANVNRRYNTDAVYVIWLDSEFERQDGLCKALLRVDGEAYTSDSSSLGIGINKSFSATKKYCREALNLVEKSVANYVGETINAKSLLKQRLDNQQHLITIRLDGITDYESIEVIGKVLNTVRGVLHAKRLGGNLNPDNPQASYETWRLSHDDKATEPFRIQANIMKMVKEVIASNGKLTLKGVPYRYNASEISLLKGVRPGRSTSKEIQFIFNIDRKNRFNSGFN